MKLWIAGTLAGLALVVATGCGPEGEPATPAAPPVVTDVPVTALSPSPVSSVGTGAPESPLISPAQSTAPTATAVADTCGAPPNSYGLNFCGRGQKVTSPPTDVCTLFTCIPNFRNGKGYLEQCNDGKVSMSGGLQGACSKHQGEMRTIYQG